MQSLLRRLPVLDRDVTIKGEIISHRDRKLRAWARVTYQGDRELIPPTELELSDSRFSVSARFPDEAEPYSRLSFYVLAIDETGEVGVARAHIPLAPRQDQQVDAFPGAISLRIGSHINGQRVTERELVIKGDVTSPEGRGMKVRVTAVARGTGEVIVPWQFLNLEGGHFKVPVNFPHGARPGDAITVTVEARDEAGWSRAKDLLLYYEPKSQEKE